VFAAVWERRAKVYEILQNGQAIPWPCLPILEGFDYWVLYVEHLADIDMHRVPKKTVQEVEVQGKKFPLLTFPKDLADAIAAVPQADGYSESFSTPKIPSEVWKALKEFHEDAERKSGTPQWIGEIDGKRYSGLGKPESGPLSHLPEGSH
jgi:hypothetical protein